jgi:predicted DNA binding protein
MQDKLVQRLRDRAYSFKAPDPLVEEAANEIERLRGYRDMAEADRDVAMLAAERLRLTDAEREAIRTAMNAYGDNNDDRECEMIEATLWGLLERTK